jgi:hypothetical protein
MYVHTLLLPIPSQSTDKYHHGQLVDFDFGSVGSNREVLSTCYRDDSLPACLRLRFQLGHPSKCLIL